MVAFYKKQFHDERQTILVNNCMAAIPLKKQFHVERQTILETSSVSESTNTSEQTMSLPICSRYEQTYMHRQRR